MNALGSRIRQLRKWRGFSQSQLEEKTGIKREYLSKLESGDLKNPTYKTMLKISNALDIPLTSLIAAIDEPVPHKDPVIEIVSPKEYRSGLKKDADNLYVAIPIIDKEVVATNPKYLGDNDVKDYALVPNTWVKEKGAHNRYRCLCLDKDDRSMLPLLNPGSIVCFDIQQNNPNTLNQQMVVIRTNEGKVFVRNFKVVDEYFVATPENMAKYCINIFPYSKEGPIVGKVVWYLQATN